MTRVLDVGSRCTYAPSLEVIQSNLVFTYLSCPLYIASPASHISGIDVSPTPTPTPTTPPLLLPYPRSYHHFNYYIAHCAFLSRSGYYILYTYTSIHLYCIQYLHYYTTPRSPFPFPIPHSPSFTCILVILVRHYALDILWMMDNGILRDCG